METEGAIWPCHVVPRHDQHEQFHHHWSHRRPEYLRHRRVVVLALASE